VRLVGIDGNRLDIEDVDMLDGDPLLDIKPYVPALDDRPEVRTGWFADRVARVHETGPISASRRGIRPGARAGEAGEDQPGGRKPYLARIA
jgi:hypothetical protein